MIFTIVKFLFFVYEINILKLIYNHEKYVIIFNFFIIFFIFKYLNPYQFFIKCLLSLYFFFIKSLKSFPKVSFMLIYKTHQRRSFLLFFSFPTYKIYSRITFTYPNCISYFWLEDESVCHYKHLHKLIHSHWHAYIYTYILIHAHTHTYTYTCIQYMYVRTILVLVQVEKGKLISEVTWLLAR